MYSLALFASGIIFASSIEFWSSSAPNSSAVGTAIVALAFFAISVFACVIINLKLRTTVSEFDVASSAERTTFAASGGPTDFSYPPATEAPPMATPIAEDTVVLNYDVGSQAQFHSGMSLRPVDLAPAPVADFQQEEPVPLDPDVMY